MLVPWHAQCSAVIVLSLFEALIILARPDTGTPLTEYITHYEPLYYDREELHNSHHRCKRSTSPLLHLDIRAHGREFKMRLRRDTRVYSPDIVIENSTGPFSYDISRAYMGHLYGEAGSHVHGVITTDGVFEGSVSSSQEKYVIEKADHFFKEKQPFHSVIYKHSDVQMDTLLASLCKGDELHRKVRQWQDEASRRHKSLFGGKSSGSPPSHNTSNTAQKHNRHTDHNMWSFKSNRSSRTGRRKRAIDPTKTTCTLYIQADHLFYQRHGRNEERVIEQLTQHIQGVNEIYSVIDFDADGEEDSINFIIKRIKVHTDKDHSQYKFKGTYGVESFLERFSEDNFDSYCLAYMFTYRDFEGGTLGLAWTGDLTNAGGVCERNGQFRGSLKSLNTGIVTVLNYGKDVPSCVSHVTMAHELGHNMGSQHDPETSDCSPGGDDGNYIMYARATSGDKPNNNRFSHCSQASMSEIMAVKARTGGGCFIPATSSICGNEVVEAGEQCDCGWEDECTDKCCNPQTENINNNQRPCTRVRGAECSPSEGPCCSENCELIGPSAHHTCRHESDCQDTATCNGTSALCPVSRNKPDRLLCNEGTSVCYQGECTSSVCFVYNLESCQCAPDVEGDFEDERLCRVCCNEPGDSEPCRPVMEWNYRDFRAVTGSPCYNYKGYCDVFHKCHEIDADGALANFKSMFFSEEGLNNLRAWLAKHWYVALAGGVGLISFIVIFIKLCAPKKKEIFATSTVSKNTISPCTTPTESKGMAVRIPTDKNTTAVRIPTDKGTAVRIPADKGAAMRIPAEKNTAVRIQSDKGTGMRIQPDKNMAVRIPCDKNMAVRIPTDKNMAVRIPTDKSMAVRIPTDKCAVVRIPLNIRTSHDTGFFTKTRPSDV